MAAINVLPKNIAELIAAGEVIERPSSVIKELVENSIDSGAKKITVEIQHGGVTYMRVTDDGCGIEKEDIRKAFLRHATSKISDKDDLDAIATLGFRGEALASICAVSKVELITKSINEQDGIRYSIEGGEEKAFDPAGCPQGTTFIVRELFYNVPARMKFLKKDVTEGNAIANLMERMALSHPEISFAFIREGKQTIRTQGDGKIENTVFQVFGKEFFNSLLPVSAEMNNISVSGYVTKPVCCLRSNRSMQMFFINGRYVHSRTAAAALEQAYKNMVMTGKYPSCILMLNMNCSMLDVNVHPAKLEVRFTNEAPIFDSVYNAVRSAVSRYDTRDEVKTKGELKMPDPKLLASPVDRGVQIPLTSPVRPAEPAVIPDPVKPETDEPDIYIPPSPRTVISYSPAEFKPFPVQESKEEEKPADYEKAETVPVSEKSEEINESVIEEAPVPSEMPEQAYTELPSARYIGEAFNTYIILEYDNDRIMFIDKHAAHERLIYERLKSENRGASSQMLLTPVSLTMDTEECRVLLENRELLDKTGFEIDSFGDRSIIIRSAPVMLEKEDIEESFSEIADYLCRHKKLIISEKMDWIYANTACRAAIKAGNKNSDEELIELARTLEQNPDVKYCPHGRPIFFFMSRREIEKQFGRIQ